jgi:hypothetical protein
MINKEKSRQQKKVKIKRNLVLETKCNAHINYREYKRSSTQYRIYIVPDIYSWKTATKNAPTTAMKVAGNRPAAAPRKLVVGVAAPVKFPVGTLVLSAGGTSAGPGAVG